LPLLRIKYYNYSKIEPEEILSFIKKIYPAEELPWLTEYQAKISFA